MKLGPHHEFIKADSHDGPLQGNVRSFFFDGQHTRSLFFNIGLFFFNNLVIPAVNSIKWIPQAMKNWFFFPLGFHMDGENTKSGGFSFRYFTGLKKPARELERMTDKKDMLFVRFAGYFVMFNEVMQPVHVFTVPGNAFRFQGTAGTAAGQINIVGKIRKFFFQANVINGRDYGKTLRLAIFLQDLLDATHTFVWSSFV